MGSSGTWSVPRLGLGACGHCSVVPNQSPANASSIRAEVALRTEMCKEVELLESRVSNRLRRIREVAVPAVIGVRQPRGPAHSGNIRMNGVPAVAAPRNGDDPHFSSGNDEREEEEEEEDSAPDVLEYEPSWTATSGDDDMFQTDDVPDASDSAQSEEF